MRSCWLWIACVSITFGQNIRHYTPPQDVPVVPDPSPICDAGSYVQASCVNHHVTVALSASSSRHFTSVFWSVNHNSVSLASATSVSALLKVHQGTTLCDEKVRVHLKVKGKNGEIDTCYTDVGVSDHLKPTFVQKVKDVLVDCDDIPVPAYVAAKDDCDKHVNVVFTEKENIGHDTSIITREWFAVDSCGNSNQMTQVVTVQDKEGPELVGVAAHVTVECDNIPKPCVVVAYDNCDDENEVTYDSKTLSGSCDDSYRIVRIWESSDNSYNAASESQTITVIDSTPPTLLGVSEIESLYCDAIPPGDDGSVTGMDNCDDQVLVKYSDSQSDVVCPHEYTLHRKWTVVDDCGNIGSAEVSCHVLPRQPQIDGIKEENLTLPCDAPIPICEPEYSDPCDYGLELQYDETTDDGTCTDEYQVFRTWWVENNCGLEVRVSQTINVVDEVPPKFTTHPPPERTVSCDHIPKYVVTAVDDCDDNVFVNDTEFTENGDGVYTTNNFRIYRSWVATDNCGNAVDMYQTVVVRDTTPPVLFGVPPDLTVECDTVPDSGKDAVSVVDDCPCDDEHLSVDYVGTRLDGTCPHEYRLIRTWSTMDCSGNVFSAVQTINVQDTTLPRLVSKQGKEYISIEELHGYVWFTDAEASDNCADVTAVEKPEERLPGTCIHNMHIARTWYVTDDCGNYVEKSYFVVVNDKVPPVLINVPYDKQTWECDDPRLADVQSDPIINGRAVNVTDNSMDDYGIYDAPQVFFDRVTVPGTCDDEYEIRLDWWAVDACGNKAEHKATIFVIDQTPPTISRPQMKVVTDDCNIPDSDIVDVDDACSEVSVVFEEYVDYATSECPSQFVIYRQWSVTDDCGNSNGPVTQTVFVEDRSPPKWIVPAPEDVTMPCVFEFDYAITPIAVNDDCHDNATHLHLELVETKIFVECDHQFRVRRKWIAQDCVGNFAYQLQTITVVDDTPPVFVTYVEENVTVPCVHDDPPPMSATDNCGYEINVKFAERKEAECPHDYILYRRWVASDVCGNKVEKFQTVTVQDNEKPVIFGPGDKMGNCDEELNAGDAECHDDCAYITMNFETSRKQRGCPHNYVVTRKWTCTDDCGKSVSHTQVVKVADLEAPTFDVYVPPQVTVECDEIPKLPFSLGGSDNCGYPLTGVFETKRTNGYGHNANKYELIRTWILKDTCGNTVLYDQTIFVDDTTPPVLHNVPAHSSVPCQHIEYTNNVYASDNCDWWVDLTYRRERKNTTCEHSYSLWRYWEAEDTCGNTATGVQVIVVTDHEKPTFLTFKPSYHYTIPTINQENIDEQIPTPRCYDNCDPSVPVSCTTSLEIGCTEDDYTLTRICTCEDDCGNQGYPVTQIVEVEDRDPCPFLSVPLDTTVSCDEDLGEVYESPTHDCAYMIMAESLVAGSCEDAAIIIKTWTITDECGNTNSTQQSVFIEDKHPPVLEKVPDYEDECEYSLRTYVNMSDNCDYSPSQTYKEVTVYYESAHDYKIVQQWFAKDRCENSEYYERTVTIKDNTPPTVREIPEDITTDHFNIPPYPEYVGCDDNCPTAYTTAEFKSTKVDGTCVQEYLLLRQWTCVDGSGLEDISIQTITVEDVSPPTFYSCPPDITQMSGYPIPFPNLIAGDNYGGNASVTKSQSSEYSGYEYSLVIRREWVAEDGCENKETCIQKIYLTEPPSILCVPDNMTIDCTDIHKIPDYTDVTAEIEECSSGKMSITFVGEETDHGTCEFEYCLIRKWQAVDTLKGSIKHNEEYETSQTICVHDLHPPHWDFPVYRTVDCSKAHLLPDYLHIHPVIAEDDCGDVTITNGNWKATDAYGYYYDYTATDTCGHSITERMQIQVVDMENPVLSDRPASFEVECVLPPPLGSPGSDPLITCDDNCGVPELETFEYVLEQSCAHRLRVVRAWRCTDDKGNSVEHKQTISVVDDHPPTWEDEMPKSTTVECDEELPSVAEYLINAEDNCAYLAPVTYLGETHDSPVTVTYATEIITIIRNWIVYDDCGLFTTWVQSIQVYDTQFPELIGVPESGEVHQCSACLCSSVTAVDNCGDPSMHSWNVTEEGSCPTEKTVITYWEAVDDVGHSVHRAHTLIIRDSEAPEFVGIDYGDIWVECHEVPPAPTDVTAVDDCDPHVSVVYKEELIKSAYWVQAELFAAMTGKEASDGYVEYDLHRTWSATDSCGHHISKVRTIHVDDTVPPVFIKKPGHTTYDCHEIGNYKYNVDSVVVEDNCAPNVYVEFDQTKEDGTCPGEYTLINSWSARDNKDNVVDHVQTVTVWDIDGPKFAYLPLKKVYLPCEDWTNYPVPSDVSANDECSSATIEYTQIGNSGTCEQEGRYLRTWVATDWCGNSKTFQQTIIVQDTEKPYCLNCPEVYSTLECPETPTTPEFTAKDVCDHSVDVVPEHDIIPGTCVGDSIYIYKWTATDDCGNSIEAVSTIRTLDTIPPTFERLPEDKEYTCEVPVDGFVNFISAVEYSDLCSEVKLEHKYHVEEGTCEFDKVYVFVFTIVDDCGNENSALSSIQIIDKTPPNFQNVPDSTTIECDVIIGTFNVIAVDDCTGVFGYTSPDISESDGTCENESIITYSWSATDECGNTDTVVVTITYKDTTPPKIKLRQFGGRYPCDDLPIVPTPIVEDNCDSNPVVHYDSTGEGSYDISNYEVYHHWSVCDNCGNCDDLFKTVSVYDEVPPVISAVSNVVVDCKEIPPVPLITCHDNCDPHVELRYIETKAEGECEDQYDIYREWECEDNVGIIVYSSYTITVDDNVPPTFEGYVPDDTTLECHESIPVVSLSAIDDCDYSVEINETCTTNDDKCDNVTVCQWIATDNCGNSDYVQWKFTVQDTTSPELSYYPENVEVPCSELNTYEGTVEGYTQFWPGVITAIDNCNYGELSVKFKFNEIPGSCEHAYQMVLHWSAVDDCGNDVNHKMTVHVSDVVPPVFEEIPRDVTVGAYATYQSLDSAIHEASASDDCDEYVKITAVESILQRQYNRECENEFLVIRVFTATDECGNTALHTYSISSIDTEAPVLPEIEDVTVECDEYEGYTDCDVVPVSLGDEDLEVTLQSRTVQEDGYFVVYKVWSVVDCAYHSAETTQTITVVDRHAPVLSRYPDHSTVSCSCEEFPVAAKIKAYDNCDGVTVDFTEETEQGTCEEEYLIVRVWEVVDSADNQEIHEQSVSVYDDEPPIFSCDEADEFAYIGDNVWDVDCGQVPEIELPLAHDDCDSDPEVVFDREDVVEEGCGEERTIARVFTATDNCGNSNEAEQTIAVNDGEAPYVLADETLCLFPAYSQDWGWWGMYKVKELFELEDNCGGRVTHSSWSCNGTDSGGLTSKGVYLEECFISTFGNEMMLYVKIDRDPDSGSAYTGRTYHLYVHGADECDNSIVFRRDIFIPFDKFMYEHRQPCPAGPVIYKKNTPTYIN